MIGVIPVKHAHMNNRRVRSSEIRFQGELSPAVARALLSFGFTEPDHARMDDLSAKARAGSLTADEQAELDTFERLSCVLDIIHSQARQALRKKQRRVS